MKRLLSDTALTGASQVVSAGAALLIQITAARSVPTESYGHYAVALALETSVEAVFVARGGELALHHIGLYWENEMGHARWFWQRLIRLDWRLNWLVCLLLLVAGYPLARAFQLPYGYLLGLGLCIPAQIGYGVYKSLFILHGQLKAQASFEILLTIITLLLSITGTLEFGIPGLIAAGVLSTLFKTLSAWLWVRRFWPPSVVATAPPASQQSVRQSGMHSVLRNTFQVGSANLDVLLLNAWSGAEAVGLYKAAKTLAGVPTRVASPLWVAIRPRLMQALRNGDLARVRKLLTLPALCFAAAGAVLLYPLLVFAPQLFQLSYGAGYSDAFTTFRILLPGNYVLGAVTGWMSFVVVVTAGKAFGTATYALQLLLVAAGGLAYGRRSPEAMASVIAATAAVTAGLAWLTYMQAKPWGMSSKEHSPP